MEVAVTYHEGEGMLQYVVTTQSDEGGSGYPIHTRHTHRPVHLGSLTKTMQQKTLCTCFEYLIPSSSITNIVLLIRSFILHISVCRAKCLID